MGMIKLPNQSINFFNENYLNIFESGNLAEGEWNRKVAEWACKYTSSDPASCACFILFFDPTVDRTLDPISFAICIAA